MSLEVRAPDGAPMIYEGDDLGAVLVGLLGDDDLRDGDIVVVTSKVVSKAEGRVRTAVPIAQRLSELEVPALVITGHGLQDIPEGLRDAGACLSKPLDMAELLALMQAIVAAEAPPEAAAAP